MDDGPSNIDLHKAAIDRIIPVTGLGHVFIGWSFGQGHGRRRLLLQGPEGPLGDLLEGAERYPRPDLLNGFGDELGDGHATAGFVAYLPVPPGADIGQTCEALFEDQTVFTAGLPEPASAGGRASLASLLATAFKDDARARAFLKRHLPPPAEDEALTEEAPEVRGYLERVDPDLTVAGWATILGLETPATAEISVNGVPVARKTAHILRPDLVAGGHARGRAGFTVTIPHAAVTRLTNAVSASVDGVELRGSPMRLGFADRIEASFLGIRNGILKVRLAGWPGERIEGLRTVDGRSAARLTLAVPEDARNAERNPGAPPPVLEGSWPLPEELRTGQPHVYGFEIREGSEVVRTDAVILRYPEYLVHVDRADRRQITGWAVRLDRPKPLSIEVYAGERRVGADTARHPRADVVENRGLPAVACGYQIDIEGLPRAREALLVMRDAETGIDLAEVALADRYEAMAEFARAWSVEGGGAGAASLHAILAPLVERAQADTGFSFRGLPRRLLPGDNGGPAPSPCDEAPAGTRPVDVVIPVYGGSVETAECLDSVLAAKNETPSRVFLVNDNSPDRLINDMLNAPRLRARQNVTVIHRTRNGGFSESVNLGMIAAGDHDVILLNADTVVQDGWIDRLARAADSDPRIASVTPLSNNGEIVTIPYACKSLPVDDPELARTVDRTVARLNAGVVVDLPVAIGFCMYIRRACLDEVGLFDADTWGRGYGEEVDFCIKSRARGWRHVLGADTFVVHRGAVSFGTEKLDRIQESARKISERYPFYDAHIQRFLASDPVEPPRRAVNLELIDTVLGADRVLHVTHAFGGGTERYVTDLVAEQRAAGRVPLILRVDSDGQAKLEIDLAGTSLEGFFRPRHVETFGPDDSEDLRAGLQRLGIGRLHVHSPFGLPGALLDWLAETYAYEMTIHDYSWICPRVTLSLPGGRYCGEPEVAECEGCVLFNGAHEGLAGLLADSGDQVAMYRERLAAFVTGAETVHVAAQDVVDRLSRHGMTDASFRQGPYPGAEAALPDPASVPRSGGQRTGPARVALFGGISDIKGYHRLLACAEYCVENEIACEFVVFGYTPDPERTARTGRIFETGRYRESDLLDLVASYQPDIAFFPNRWPETYSYTLSHSFRFGLWPIVTDIGAPAERVRACGFGTVVPLDARPADLVKTMLDLARRARDAA